jgi:pilus assembly protein FimV
MTDSTDNTNELDSYGVWVKRPSNGGQPEASETDNQKSSSDDFNLDADLPDFSELDTSSVASDILPESGDTLQDDTTLSTEELSDITDTVNSEDTAVPGFSEIQQLTGSGAEDIDIEDFFDEGPAKQPEEASAEPGNEEKTEPQAVSGESEEVSLDDFFDSDITSNEPAKQEDVPDEAPLDINLSFSNEDVPADEAEPEVQDTNSADTESVDVSAFDTSVEGENPAAENTESVSMDSFDDMFNSITDTPLVSPDTPIEEEEENPAEEGTSGDTSMESVKLSDFGVDENAEETPIASSTVTENKPKATVDYDLSVTEDTNVAAAPVVNEIKSKANDNTVPDSFDEETESLIAPPLKTVSEPQSEPINNALLQQIVSDLSGLKDEISGLKKDFAELKAHEELLSASASDKKAEGGFFADEDEDETVSLSGDELDNIMNTADFTTTDENEKPEAVQNEAGESPDDSASGPAEESAVEEETEPDTEEPAAETEPSEQYEEVTDVPVEPEVTSGEEPVQEPAEELSDSDLFGAIDSAPAVPDTPALDETTSSELTMNFDNEKLEEPDLNSLPSDSPEESVSEELPEEISIPKVDDILVESSPTDFMDSVKDTTDDIMQPDAEEITDLSASTEEIIPDEKALQEEEESVNSTEESSDGQFEEPEVADTTSDNIFGDEASVADTLTSDNIDYLNTDEEAKKELDTNTQPDADTNSVPAPEKEQKPVSVSAGEKNDEIPGDITQEVKSVLLYMDQLLENLPEDKIIEFAHSEQFATYKKLFSDLGLS